MKRILTIAILASIVLSTTGIVVARHYCKIAFSESCNKNCCEKSTVPCCNTEVKFYQLDYVTLVSDQVRVEAGLIPAKPVYLPELYNQRFTASYSCLAFRAPPGPPAQALLQSFLI